MQRLGLCCLFHKQPIKFRTTTVRYTSSLSEKGKEPLEHIHQLILHNLNSLMAAIEYCHTHEIGAFRIQSGLLPLYTHPKYGYTIDDLPDSKEVYALFISLKNYAQKHNIRLSFHPDQFTVLNAIREDVVENSITELEYHGVMAQLLGADVINIHGGGGYGDKPAALQRFSKNFQRLSSNVQTRLTVENDDKIFTPQDLLPLCHELNIPLVYDVHHHRCLPDRYTIENATERALHTWKREPLFHISSPKEGWEGAKPRLHHDFIDLKDVPELWSKIDPLTVDVEAKAKELAVLRLQKSLTAKGWHFSN